MAIVVGFIVLSVIAGLGDSSSSSSSSSSEKTCKYCGQKTSWTYRNNGWICYSCDKKYGHVFMIPEIDGIDYNLITA